MTYVNRIPIGKLATYSFFASIEASGYYFEEMEAFDESDKIKIKSRILEVCGSAKEFNKGVNKGAPQN